MKENISQNPGKLLSGHENPVRKRQIGDMNRNIMKTVSLCLTRWLNVRLNITLAGT